MTSGRSISLTDIVGRTPRPEPWSEGHKIPWDDPAFSARMLSEHLSQDHDLASRRLEVVDRHADWILATQLGGRAGRVLDLGCGPGLYTSALARRGVSCVGIDFAPASVAHARQLAATEGLDCRYIEGDLRVTDFGAGFDLVLLIYGELNAFRREEAADILARARASLAKGGRVVVESHTAAAVERIGRGRRDGPRTWRSAEAGLFSDRPHLQLYEAMWDPDRATATERYYIVDVATAEVIAYAQSMQAYDAAAYETLFLAAGLEITSRYGTLEGGAYEPDADLFVLVAEPRADRG